MESGPESGLNRARQTHLKPRIAALTCRDQRGHMKHKNILRNRQIYAAYLRGQTLEDLAKIYRLRVGTVKHILDAERLKHAVSGEEFYRRRRDAFPSQADDRSARE